MTNQKYTGLNQFFLIFCKVNNELNELHNGMNLVRNYLRPETGRLAVISFHSLEDKIIKDLFNDVDIKTATDESSSSRRNSKTSSSSVLKFKMNPALSADSLSSAVTRSWIPLNKKVIVPSDEEIKSNPRSRSAKLRVACKTF